MSSCSEQTSMNYLYLFLASLGVTITYYMIKGFIGVSLDEPGEFARFIVIMMCLIALTILLFIWWLNIVIRCNTSSDSVFKDEIEYLKNGYFALAALTTAAILSFFYSQFRHYINPHFNKRTGFDLPAALYGGKRKRSKHHKN
jgi:uncharacterized protein involved in cysteine biosynthesis